MPDTVMPPTPQWAGRFCLAPVLFASLGIIALSYWYLLHAPPLADDFYRAWEAGLQGPVHGAWNSYLNWGGRWASMLLEYGYASLLDPVRHYPLILGLLSGLHWLAALSTAVLLTGRGPCRGRVWALAAMIFALVWVTCPEVGEGYYWAPGLVEYSLSLSLGLALLALLRRPAPVSARARGVRTAAVALLAMLATAGHEVLGALVMGVVILDAVYARRQKEPRARLSLLAGIIALAAWISVALAPGNWVRFADAAAQGALNSADLGLLWRQFGGLVWHALGNSTLLAAGLLLMLRPGLERPAARPALWVWAAPLLTLAAFSFVFWGAVLVLGQPAPWRLQYAAHLILVTGLLFSCEVWRRAWGLSRLAGRFRPGLAVCLLAGLTLLSLTQRPNLGRGLADLKLLPDFRAGMTQRFQDIGSQVAGGQKHVVIADRLQWPRLYAWFLDLPAAGENYVNKHWRLYFGADSILKTPVAELDQGPLPWTRARGYVSGLLKANGVPAGPLALVVTLNGRVAARCLSLNGFGRPWFAAVLAPPPDSRPPYEVRLAVERPGGLTPLETRYRFPGWQGRGRVAEKDGGVWHLSANGNGPRLAVKQDAAAGWLDQVRDLGGVYGFQGWAAQKDLAGPAGTVMLVAGNRVLWSGPPRERRGDVARAFDAEALERCGYTILVPKELVPGCAAPRVLAVGHKGEAAFLPPGPMAREQLSRLFSGPHSGQ